MKKGRAMRLLQEARRGRAERLKGSLDGEIPTWRQLVAKSQDILYRAESPEKLSAIHDELRGFIRGGGKGAKRPELRAMQTLAEWRLTGELKASYRNLIEARIQMWEYENYCPVFAFQKQFLKKVSGDYPRAPGPKMFREIMENIGEVHSDEFVARNLDFVVLRRPNAKKTIVGFAGLGGSLSGLSWTMFDRAIAQKINANLVVLRDRNHRFYLAGVKSLGNRQDTVAVLRQTLAGLNTPEVVAIGGSLGVFGALLLSCDLGVKQVIASSGPTSLDIGHDEGDRQWYLKTKEMADKGLIEYPDLAAEVARSKIERVDFFLAGQHDFDMRQMRNLADRTDVVVPHIYSDLSGHTTISQMIMDGSLLKLISK
jgi:hypothetical protein